ncbi:MAG: histidine kinase, partial [Ekhidna sp.]
KFNVRSKGDSWKGNQYLSKVLTPVTFMEGLLSIYFIYGIFSGFKLEDYGLMLFHGMLAIGFAYVFILSVKPMNNA